MGSTPSLPACRSTGKQVFPPLFRRTPQNPVPPSVMMAWAVAENHRSGSFGEHRGGDTSQAGVRHGVGIGRKPRFPAEILQRFLSAPPCSGATWGRKTGVRPESVHVDAVPAGTTPDRLRSHFGVDRTEISMVHLGQLFWVSGRNR
jgi:hypothetical protein